MKSHSSDLRNATAQSGKEDIAKSSSYDPLGTSNDNAENADGWGWGGDNSYSGVEPQAQTNIGGILELGHALDKPAHEVPSHSVNQFAVSAVENSYFGETAPQEDLLLQPQGINDPYKPIMSSECRVLPIATPNVSTSISESKQADIPGKVEDDSWGAEIRSVDVEFSSTVAGIEVPSGPIRDMTGTPMNPYASTTVHSAFVPSSLETKPAEPHHPSFYAPPQHQQPQT